MIEILEAARSVGVRVYFAPHHRSRPGDYATWRLWAPIQKGSARSKATLEISAPSYARAIVSTNELIASMLRVGA